MIGDRDIKVPTLGVGTGIAAVKASSQDANIQIVHTAPRALPATLFNGIIRNASDIPYFHRYNNMWFEPDITITSTTIKIVNDSGTYTDGRTSTPDTVAASVWPIMPIKFLGESPNTDDDLEFTTYRIAITGNTLTVEISDESTTPVVRFRSIVDLSLEANLSNVLCRLLPIKEDGSTMPLTLLGGGSWYPYIKVDTTGRTLPNTGYVNFSGYGPSNGTKLFSDLRDSSRALVNLIISSSVPETLTKIIIHPFAVDVNLNPAIAAEAGPGLHRYLRQPWPIGILEPIVIDNLHTNDKVMNSGGYGYRYATVINTCGAITLDFICTDLLYSGADPNDFACNISVSPI